MIRRKPLRRAPWRSRGHDEPRARGRPSASAEEWQAIRTAVVARADWRCQACGRGGRLDVHHVVKRSQGGSDWDLEALVALCRRCHAQTDAPYVKGRLVVIPQGAGQFVFEVVAIPPRSPRWPAIGEAVP
jgi:5-methylcytosine-specific restriction endonuclease McrA